MKRKGNLYETMLSEENIRAAILRVNRGHRWYAGHKANKTVAAVEANIPGHAAQLRRIIEEGFVPKRPKVTERWDKSAGKWRNISQPALWPDQYVHHVLIGVLEPVLLPRMDPWCCGSIKERGIHYGMNGIKKWMKNDRKGTRYCLELDIRHFYDELQPSVVMERLRQLVKDRRVLELAERVMIHGILAGCYFSQWFANTVLQPLDDVIRKTAAHYLRYMDNFTIFGPNKRKLHRLKGEISAWLGSKGLAVKGNWQIFPTQKRMPCGLGYRYGRNYTLLRKRNLLRIKRQIAGLGKQIRIKTAAGLLSRLGQLKHCNRKRIFEQTIPKGLQSRLKQIVREWTRKERGKWNTVSALPGVAAGTSST